MSQRPHIADKVKFDKIRYAQCWEDADVLLQAMAVGTGATCLSIASAGDNTLALAGAGVKRVIAVDMNPAQVACLELRMAACRALCHAEFLALMGQGEHPDRVGLYGRCAPYLPAASRAFWDGRIPLIRHGIGQAGRFERFLRVFRRVILPVVVGRRHVDRVFELESRQERKAHYERHWNKPRFRTLCRYFFGRASLGRFGRDPEFTRYADEPVWQSLQRRIPQALVVQDPRRNPYLQWILKGRYETALPWAWRAENYDRIRANLDAIEIRCEPLESVLASLPANTLDGCNLSDIFEYMSDVDYHALLRQLTRAGAPGARLVYWNVVVSRSRPCAMADRLQPLRALAESLHTADKAFFYRDLVIEEVS
jgi:S-adenosylmethionine-diacylglycerol 3-amino-3-carboxypropyl transferase